MFGEKGAGRWAALAVSDISWLIGLPVTAGFWLEEQFPICLMALGDDGEDPAHLLLHRAASHTCAGLPGFFTKSNRVSAEKRLSAEVPASITLC